MLAIQRPMMGSTQPSDPDLPFGYTIDPSQELLFLEPPEPAPGAPLLNEHDARFLNSFFDDMTSDHFAGTSFGEGLNFSEDWLNLPPQLMGTATTFGQQPGPSLESPIHSLANVGFHEPLSSPSALMPPPPPPPPPQARPAPPAPSHLEHTPADVLAAATLLQNGSMQRHRTGPHHDRHAYAQSAPLGSPVDHAPPHQSVPNYGDEGRRASQPRLSDGHIHAYTEMVFGNGGQAGAQQQAPPPPNNPHIVEMRWGSDSSFNKVGFVPHSTKETGEALESERLKYIECFEVSRSAANTRPSSPVANGTSPILQTRPNPQMSPVRAEPDAAAPPRKRRKSRVKDEAEELLLLEEEAINSTAAAAAAAAAPQPAPPTRKRKNKADGVWPTSPAEAAAAPGKRRKSSANAPPKLPRENLTDEQKRENHIRSEQKRRTLIKEGFDDLCELVPGLKGGGFSKSTMLTMAAEWLEELLRGNEELRQMARAYNR